MEASLDQLKQRARTTWAAGNFDEIAKVTWEVGGRLVGDVGVASNMAVLDVACGTGNATIPAAQTGATTTGVDLTPELFDAAAQHAAEAGVEVNWVEGDAEALPFDDASFDIVLSTFGVMFAPRHVVAAAELGRVCKPGGKVGLACWTPEGTVGEMFRTLSARMPAPPSYASPPPLWGVEEHVRELLEPHGFELTCHKLDAVMRGDSVEHIVGRMETNFGPWKMAQVVLGDDWPALRQQLYEVYERGSRPHEGRVATFAEYLQVVGTKTA
jgi:ubiquinone/menaquinone biosynthesis C-methylase UbiE